MAGLKKGAGGKKPPKLPKGSGLIIMIGAGLPHPAKSGRKPKPPRIG